MPMAMVGVNVVAAETDEEAQFLFTSLQQQALRMARGRPGRLPPPVRSMNELWSPAEREHVLERTSVSAVGSVETVREQLERILAATEADELMLTAHIFDQRARLRSFEFAAQAMGGNAEDSSGESRAEMAAGRS